MFDKETGDKDQRRCLYETIDLFELIFLIWTSNLAASYYVDSMLLYCYWQSPTVYFNKV